METREEFAKHIEKGGVVRIGDQTIARVEDLPDDLPTEKAAPRRRGARATEGENQESSS